MEKKVSNGLRKKHAIDFDYVINKLYLRFLFFFFPVNIGQFEFSTSTSFLLAGIKGSDKGRGKTGRHVVHLEKKKHFNDKNHPSTYRHRKHMFLVLVVWHCGRRTTKRTPKTRYVSQGTSPKLGLFESCKLYCALTKMTERRKYLN